jgi:hypothetical protein
LRLGWMRSPGDEAHEERHHIYITCSKMTEQNINHFTILSVILE